MEKFRWCFIGAGSLAQTVANQFRKSDTHEIVSCYSRRYESARAFTEKHGGRAYEKAEDAITAEGVDAVYIVTPHNAHYRYVKMALELGKPVFCEKAFTVTADETKELISLAREKKLYLCEAMWTWFSFSANQTKKWIDEGKIGKIQSAEFLYHIRTVGYKGRHTDPKRAGGALLDITVYPVTYAYRLWGKPEKIESKAKLKDGIDLGEDIVFTYSDGKKIYISASIDDFKGLEKMTIRGEKGVIKAPFFHAMNGVTCKTGLFRREKVKGNGPKLNSYLDEFDAVAEDIRSGRKESEMVPLQATADVMELLDEIREQIGLSYDELE
ncbi:MAG: Gfo/Idh/MocA family oxidoreductase [Clostridia bacterium]|nr:Gfo/Idh/MocA family oxidoreductase [Clostridia bacterium]